MTAEVLVGAECSNTSLNDAGLGALPIEVHQDVKLHVWVQLTLSHAQVFSVYEKVQTALPPDHAHSFTLRQCLQSLWTI